MTEAPPSSELNRLASGLRTVGERLDRIEKSVNPDVILLKLDHLGEAIGDVQHAVDKINSRVAKNEVGVIQHETRIALMETFCQEQVKPALQVIMENRTQLAVIAAKYGAVGLGAGSGIGLVFLGIAKMAGWL